MTDFSTHRPPYFPTHVIRDVRHPAIRCEEKAIFFAMADRQQNPTDLITASIGTIADDAGVSRKTAQRVVSWAVSVGIISVHFRDGFRCYGFHLDMLVGLPTSTARDKLRVGPPVPSKGPTVPGEGPAVLGGTSSYQGPPVHSMGPADLVQCPAVPCSVPAGPPKVQEKDQSRTNQGPISANVPSRFGSGLGPLFESQTSTAAPQTSAPLPVAQHARPEPTSTPGDVLPVPTPRSPATAVSEPAQKPVRKATKSRAKELSPEQAKTFRQTTDVFWAEFQKAKGEKPILNLVGRDRKVIIEFLDKLQWDGEKAGEIIRNAFSQAYYRERFSNFDELVKNTTRYQGGGRVNSTAQGGTERIEW